MDGRQAQDLTGRSGCDEFVAQGIVTGEALQGDFFRGGDQALAAENDLSRLQVEGEDGSVAVGFLHHRGEACHVAGLIAEHFAQVAYVAGMTIPDMDVGVVGKSCSHPRIAEEFRIVEAVDGGGAAARQPGLVGGERGRRRTVRRYGRRYIYDQDREAIGPCGCGMIVYGDAFFTDVDIADGLAVEIFGFVADEGRQLARICQMGDHGKIPEAIGCEGIRFCDDNILVEVDTGVHKGGDIHTVEGAVAAQVAVFQQRGDVQPGSFGADGIESDVLDVVGIGRNMAKVFVRRLGLGSESAGQEEQA
jgi:hypothetical protein